MKRCKIEVIKTTWDEALAKEYGVTCKCPAHKVGEIFYGDWIQTPGISINSCNDGIRTVVFKITRLDEDAADLYPQQEKQ